MTKRKHETLRAVWNGKELICTWSPFKFNGSPALAVDRRWIALDKYVQEGSWIKQGQEVSGLRCTCLEAPKTVVLAEVKENYKEGNGSEPTFEYSVKYLAQVDVSRSQ